MTNIKDSKFNIVCLSNQLWDFPNWTNKRHVMARMAKVGHKVIFVDPPINAGRLLLRQIFRSHWNISRIITQLKKENENIFVFSPLNLIPLNFITSYLHVLRIKSLSKKLLNKNVPTVLWVYHVEINKLGTYLNNLEYDLLVYDCVDNYEGFPKYDSIEKKKKIRKQEENLTKQADVVFASAPGLVDKLNKTKTKVFYAPNVGDYEKFKGVPNLRDAISKDLIDIPRPRIGFVGALDEYKFDFDLFKKLLTDHSNYSFVLIGQIALKDRNASLKEIGLDGYKNVFFLKAKPFPIIQNYMAGFDAFIIPYQLNDYTVGGCFPIKFHDSLASGLPTVVTGLPAYDPFKHVAYISKDYNEFSLNITKALEENSSAKVKERQAAAKDNNWENKTSTMENIVNSYLV